MAASRYVPLVKNKKGKFRIRIIRIIRIMIMIIMINKNSE
jgi:hypothetical protein